MIDWNRNRQMLIEGSETVIRSFLASHADDELCAIGYVFELWNASPQFDLCANTRSEFEESMAMYRAKWPGTSEDEIRWNSGNYQFPAGLLRSDDELGSQWSAEAARLHLIADREEHAQEVYDGLIQIGCEALAELARRGLFGDWSKIDFNVSEYGDAIEIVKKRDRLIRALIEGKADSAFGPYA